MIVAGSSADDVYVVVVFTALISLAQGGKVSAAGFLQVPVSIVLGNHSWCYRGMVLVLFFQRFHMRDYRKSYNSSLCFFSVCHA